MPGIWREEFSKTRIWGWLGKRVLGITCSIKHIIRIAPDREISMVLIIILFSIKFYSRKCS